MEKVSVLISWSGDNYCASAVGDHLNGSIISTHKTLPGVKQAFAEALQFHIEGLLADGDEVLPWLKEGKYELEFSYV
jgi:hypothetical protein